MGADGAMGQQCSAVAVGKCQIASSACVADGLTRLHMLAVVEEAHTPLAEEAENINSFKFMNVNGI